MIDDLIPSIHAVRASLLEEQRGNGQEQVAEEEEVALLMSRLLHLESRLENYEELVLVRKLKEGVTRHASLGEEKSNFAEDDESAGLEDNITVGKRRGLEPVRGEVLSELQQAVADAMTEAQLDLLTVEFPAGSSSSNKKKQKSSGYFSNFNFDDLPAFEPLELTLRTLRTDPCNLDALQKLLDMDVGELVEHPQWYELLSLLYVALISSSETCNEQIVTKVLHLHVLLMHSFTGAQAIDAACNLINYLLRQWTSTVSAEAPSSSFITSTLPSWSEQMTADELFSISPLLTTQLAILVDVLRYCSGQLQHSSEKKENILIGSIFVLLARGRLPLASNMPVLDALALTTENGSSATEIVRNMKPLAIVLLAVQSGLLETLACRIKHMSGSIDSNTTSLPVESSSSSRSSSGLSAFGSLRFGLDSNIFLAILTPFACNALTLEMLCSSQNEPNLHWDCRLASSKVAASSSSPSLAMPANDADSILVEVAPETNKMFFQLSGAAPLLPSLAAAAAADASTSGMDQEGEEDVVLSTSARQFPQLLVAIARAFSSVASWNLQGTLGFENLLVSLLRLASYQKATIVQSEVVSYVWQAVSTEGADKSLLSLFMLGLQEMSSLTFRNDGKLTVECLARVQFMSTIWTSVAAAFFSLFSNSCDLQQTKDTACAFVGGLNQHLALLTFLSHRFPSPCTSAATSKPISSSYDEAITECILQTSSFCIRCINGETCLSIDSSSSTPTTALALFQRNAFSIGLGFLVTATETPDLVLLQRSSGLLEAIVEIFLSCLAGCCSDTREWDPSLETSPLIASLLTIVRAVGPVVLLQSQSMALLVEALYTLGLRSDIWESAESWYGTATPILPLLELLTGLAMSGNADSALVVMARAWESIRSLCREKAIEKASQLVALFAGKNGQVYARQLSCEGIYLLLLRVLGSAFANVTFCLQCSTHVLSSSASSISSSTSMQLQEEEVELEDEEEEEKLGMDETDVFLHLAQTQIRSLGASSERSKIFFPLLNERDLRVASLCLSAGSSFVTAAATAAAAADLVGEIDTQQLFSLSSGGNFALASKVLGDFLASQPSSTVASFFAASTDAPSSTNDAIVALFIGYYTQLGILQPQDESTLRAICAHFATSRQGLEWFIAPLCLLSMSSDVAVSIHRVTLALNFLSSSYTSTRSEAGSTWIHWHDSWLQEIETMTLALLVQYDGGSVLNTLLRLGLPAHLVIRHVLSQWFTEYFCAKDVLTVTACSIVSGPREAANALALLLIEFHVVLVGTSSPTADIVEYASATCGGAEAFLRAALLAVASFSLSTPKSVETLGLLSTYVC